MLKCQKCDGELEQKSDYIMQSLPPKARFECKECGNVENLTQDHVHAVNVAYHGGYKQIEKDGEEQRKKMKDSENIKEESIYTLKLHEKMDTHGGTITRVAGGWIYETIHGVAYVPYDNEFQKNKEVHKIKQPFEVSIVEFGLEYGGGNDDLCGECDYRIKVGEAYMKHKNRNLCMTCYNKKKENEE